MVDASVGNPPFFSQVIKFFGAVGEGLGQEVASRSDESPVWLSTSGLGVYWYDARRFWLSLTPTCCVVGQHRVDINGRA